MTEPALGEIRLRWWLDSIDAIYAGVVSPHPVIQELAAAIEHGDLPGSAFRNMIMARRFDIYDDPMPTLNDLEGYLGDTASALIQLSSLVLDRTAALGCASVSGLAGVAMGIAGILRSLPRDRARGRCYVPVEILQQHGLTSSNLVAGRPEEQLVGALTEVRSAGANRLAEARALQQAIPTRIFPAFLPVALTGLYFGRLGAKGPAILTTVADISQLRRQWHLYRSARSRTF